MVCVLPALSAVGDTGGAMNAAPRTRAVRAQSCAEGSALCCGGTRRAEHGLYTTGGDLLQQVVLKVNQRQVTAGRGFHEEGDPMVQYCRGCCWLFFTFVPVRALLCHRIINYIFHVRSFQV